MSGKRNKRERKLVEEMMELAGPIFPIIPEALEQIGNDGEEIFAQWISIALTINELNPDLPIEKLLPDVLDNTIFELGPQFEEMLGQAEDVP